MPWNQYGENGGSYLVRGRHQMWIWPGWRRATRKSAVSPKSPRLGDIWWKGKKKGNPAVWYSKVLIYMFRSHWNGFHRFLQTTSNNIGFSDEHNSLTLVPAISCQSCLLHQAHFTPIHEDEEQREETEEAGIKLLFSDASSTFLCWRQYIERKLESEVSPHLSHHLGLISSIEWQVKHIFSKKDRNSKTKEHNIVFYFFRTTVLICRKSNCKSPNFKPELLQNPPLHHQHFCHLASHDIFPCMDLLKFLMMWRIERH